MTAVLGIRLGPAHDTGAALVYEHSDELRCVAVAEARLSRIKHSRAFPRLAIDACLNEIGTAGRDLDAVIIEKNIVYYGTRGIERLPGPAWEWFDTPEETGFARELGAVPLYLVNHHLAHAASAWHTTDWPRDGLPGALLVADGRGSMWEPRVTDGGPVMYTFPRNPDLATETGREHHDRRIVPVARRAETQTVFRAQGRRIERAAVSLRSGAGGFYSWVTQMILGFGHMHAGKTMGLAAFGDAASGRFPGMSHVLDGIDTDFMAEIDARFDGGLAFRMRRDEAPTDPYFADAAAWAQREITRAVVHLARYALEHIGARRLGYAGGVALNVLANRAALDTLKGEDLLDDLFIQPAASDEGLALGGALLGYYQILGKTKPFQKNQVYLGPTVSPTIGSAELRHAGATAPADLIDRVADLLLDGKIVGWLQGRSEHGPRALGARSILCWARPHWMKDHLNLRVKHREAFRPFAPIVNEEHAGAVFDLGEPAPYMLIGAHVLPGRGGDIPAVTHADGSARLQTVDREHTPLLAALLDEIYRRDGVGVLLNTSFNDNNEPIVETARDSLDCYERTGLDALVCGRHLLCRGTERRTSGTGAATHNAS